MPASVPQTPEQRHGGQRALEALWCGNVARGCGRPQGRAPGQGMHPPSRGGHEGMRRSDMATILAADYEREDFLALGSPLVSTLRAWGYEVVEAENSLDVLQQASRVHPDAVVLYDTL